MVRRSPTGACQCSRVLASPRNPRSSRLGTSTSSSTWSSPASAMSSCSWQLPGQPPSHHKRSPWMVEMARPWAVWAWRLASYRTFWLAHPRGRCTRVASPSTTTASPAAVISPSQWRRSSRLVMKVPSGWQYPRAASGPSSRSRLSPTSVLEIPTARPARRYDSPSRMTAATASKRTSSDSGGVPPCPGGRGGCRWARRSASQARACAGSEERGQYDKGTRPPGRLENLAYGLVPVNVGTHRASRTPSVRHPLSTSGSGSAAVGAVAVGDVGGLVVEHALVQAVPQHLQPVVAERAQGGVVGLAAGALGVIERPCPAGFAQRAERPLLDRGGQVAVAGQPAGHHQFGLAGAAGDGGFAGVACQRVRRLELFRVVADLVGDPGGEAVTKAGKAQVDLAARERLPQLVLWWGVGASLSRGAQQQRAHAALPGATLVADGQQLGGAKSDRIGLGADQVVPRGELVAGQRRGDLVGQALGPAVVGRSGEGDQFVAGCRSQGLGGGPALQQLEDGRGAQVVAGDLQGGWEGRDEVLAQPVEQAALVAGGTLVIAGDRPELAGQLAMGNQWPQAGVAVKCQQAGDAGVFGVVLVAGRPSPPGDQVGVDRQDRVAGVDQSLDQHASFGRRHGCRHGAVLMDQSSGDDTLVGVGPAGPTPWDAVSRQSSRDKQAKRSQGETP